MTKKSIGEISVDARLLYERLKKASVGDLVTYQELGAIISRNVQSESYSVLQTARRRCLNEDMIVFGTVENEGLKRLSPAEIASSGEYYVRHARRTVRKGIKILSALKTEEFDSLSNEDKIRHNADRSALGLFDQMMRPATIKKIEAQVSEEKTALSLAKCLSALT